MDTQSNQTPTQNAVDPFGESLDTTINNKKSNSAVVWVITIILLVLTLAFGYYLLIYNKKSSENKHVTFEEATLEENEVEYTNTDLGFRIFVDKSWDVKELGSGVTFISDSGNIYIEELKDDDLSSVKDIDDEFCKAFGTGFSEWIPNFDFELFQQGDIKGCTAEGEVSGVRQKYNIFYNPENSSVYTVSYVVKDLSLESRLSRAISTFTLTIK